MGHVPLSVRLTPYVAQTEYGSGLHGQRLAIVLAEGGRAAQAAFGVSMPTSAVTDREDSSRAALSLARRDGGSAADYLAEGFRTAMSIVRANRAVLARLAGILEARTYLAGDELAAILEDVVCPSN